MNHIIEWSDCDADLKRYLQDNKKYRYILLYLEHIVRYVSPIYYVDILDMAFWYPFLISFQVGFSSNVILNVQTRIA